MRGRKINWECLNRKEKGYLFGMFEGDGYKIYDKKSRHYHIEFYLNSEKDKKIINFIIDLLNKIGLKSNLYQDKRCKCMRIRVYCKELFNILSKNIDLKNKSKDFSIGFISGLIDSEGHYNKDKSYIMIINTNKDVLDNSKKFLNRIKINSSINERILYKKDRKKSYRMYISVNFKRLNHLSIKVL